MSNLKFHEFFTLALPNRCLAISAACLMTITLAACDLSKSLEDVTKQAVAALDNAISRLEIESSDWQNTLKQLESDLVDDARLTIKNDVNHLIGRGIALAGGEVRCTADFIGDRLLFDLRNLKSQLLGEEQKKRQPFYCSANPETVDLRIKSNDRPVTTIYGYNFDITDPVQVKLVEKNGSEIDVTNKVDYPSYYSITIETAGASGIEFSDESERLVVVGLENRPELSIGIVHPEPVPQARCVAPSYVDAGYPEGRAFVDFDGDGCEDYCRLRGRGANIAMSCAFGFREGGTNFDPVFPPLLSLTNGVDWGYPTHRYWVDVNADGKADYCRVVGNHGQYRMGCTLSSGRSVGATMLLTSASGLPFYPYIDRGYENTGTWKDVNGDSKPDFCREVGNRPNTFRSCLLSNGTSFVGEQRE